MLHPLQQKIVTLRRRVRRTAVVYGASLAAAAGIAAIVAIGLVDSLLRFEDRGLRVIASLGALSLLGWACYRFLLPALSARFTDAELARHIERSFPGLQNRLQSAIEFLGQSEEDPAAGSPALRRVVIAQAAAESQGIEFDDVVDHRPARRAVALLAAVCLLAVGLIVAGPSSARIAMARLISPLGRTGWPRLNNLQVRRAPERLARGQAFQVEVVDQDRARLPADVRIYYRTETPDGAAAEESERMQFAEGAMTARRDNVRQSFAYRVEGGDDRSMPWSEVEVVDPPAIESLRIQAIPPAYTGWPATDSSRNVRAIVGTRLRIGGRATKPLRSADLCLEGGRRVAGRLGDDGRSFTVAEFVVDKSSSYWFELIDGDGFRGGDEDRWEIHAVTDAAPVVNIVQPAANMLVTPRAVSPLRVSARDDLALRDVAIVFRTGDAGPERTLPLWKASSPTPSKDGQPQGRTIDYRWELEGLQLRPGTDLTFFAKATDDRPQAGRSEPRRLSVVTPDELLDRLAAREKLIAGELDRALGMQRACRGQVESLRLRSLPRFEQADLDQLQAVEHAQQEVAQLLAGRGEGLPSHIDALLADLENNRVPGTEVQRRMAGLREELIRLARDRLPVIGRELTAARKTAQADRESTAGLSGPLKDAAGQQDAVIAALEQWLTQLARWDSYGRFHREIAQMLREQEELTRRTSDVGRRTLGEDLRDVAPRDAASLSLAAAAEIDLARRLDRTLQGMEQAAGQLRPTDPVAADTMADALDAARRLGVAAEMRTAAGTIERNQMGEAASGQKQIAQDLQEVLDVLANRQAEAARLVKRLRKLEGDLASLEARQAELNQQMHAASRAPTASGQTDEARRRELQRLARQQEALRLETQRLTRQLERLQSEQAAAAASQAAEQMDRAGQAAAQGNQPQAGKQAAEAEKSLAEARRQLAERVRQAAAELSFEQLARLDDALKHLSRQQQNALEEARRLWGLEQSQGNLTRAQAAAVSDLARLQRSLCDDVARATKQFAGAGAFHLALDTAADEMQTAAGALDRRQLGPPTQEPQGRALRQLELVVEAIKPEPPAKKEEANADQQGQQQGNRRATPPSNGIPSVAELKLLRLLQVEINVDIERLQGAVGVGKPTDEQVGRYRDLSRRQGRLADIVQQSLEQGQPKHEGKPAAPPDDRKRGAGPLGDSPLPVRLAVADTAVLALVYQQMNDADEQLQRELGAAAEKEDDAMLRIGRQMRDSQRRIGRADSGEATQKLQRNIVAELDRLIEQSRKKSGQCQPGACQPKPGNKQGNKASNKPGSKSGVAPSSKPAGQSRREADGQRARTTMKQLWGELPERARQQMLQLPDEEFPPKYELLIEDYFRRLSEEKKEK
ncbi:MAG: hypothetical protein ABFC96_05370 [Thermoguttaceae bacterium]